MNLKQFAETYFELEDKALEIIKIYMSDDYNLLNFHIYNDRGEIRFQITATACIYGSITDDYIEFSLSEMENDLGYFKQKRKEELIQIEENKQNLWKAQALINKREKEEKDKLEYERLKKKFGK